MDKESRIYRGKKTVTKISGNIPDKDEFERRCIIASGYIDELIEEFGINELSWNMTTSSYYRINLPNEKPENELLERVENWPQVSFSSERKQFIQSVVDDIEEYLQSEEPTTLVICLEGPPGMGKSTLIYEIAKLSRLPTYKVSTIRGEVVSQASQSIDRLFLKLRTMPPSIAIWDEIDSVVARRLHANSANAIEHNTTVATLFKNMDMTRTVLLCTTNKPENIDEAFLSRIQKHRHQTPTLFLMDRLTYLRSKLPDMPDDELNAVSCAGISCSFRDLDNFCRSYSRHGSVEILYPRIWYAWRAAFKDRLLHNYADRRNWTHAHPVEDFSVTGGIRGIVTDEFQLHLAVIGTTGVAVGRLMHANGHINVLYKKEGTVCKSAQYIKKQNVESCLLLCAKHIEMYNESNHKVIKCDEIMENEIIEAIPIPVDNLKGKRKVLIIYDKGIILGRHALSIVQIQDETEENRNELKGEIVGNQLNGHYSHIQPIYADAKEVYFVAKNEDKPEIVIIKVIPHSNQVTIDECIDITKLDRSIEMVNSLSIYKQDQNSVYIACSFKYGYGVWKWRGPNELKQQTISLLRQRIEYKFPFIAFDPVNGRLAISLQDSIRVYPNCLQSFSNDQCLEIQTPKDGGDITCLLFLAFGLSVVWGTSQGTIFSTSISPSNMGF